jgi:hypothetical protein
MFARICLIVALLFPVVAVADDAPLVVSGNIEYATTVPGTRAVTVADANGDTYTVVNAVGATVDRKPILLAQADTGSAHPTIPAAAPAADPAPAVTVHPEPADIGVATKLYRNGSFFGLGIMVLFVGLVVAGKVDKKRAFYYATAAGGLAVLVESIRRGDTPSATMAFSTVMPTVGIMIAGPGHTKA